MNEAGNPPRLHTVSADNHMVRQFARVAAFQLSQQREPAVSAILSAWLEGATELSRKMSAPEYQTLLPATTFSHPVVPEEE